VLPAGAPTGPFCPILRAILAMLAGSYRFAKRPIQQLVCDLFGLDVPFGMIPKLERQAAEVLGRAAAIVAATSAHIDETSWAEANEKAWLWVGRTESLTVFTIGDNRGADLARSIVGTDPEKVAISDRFPSYEWIEQHQDCWAHLCRDFQPMIDRQDDGSAIGADLLEVSDRRFHWWHRHRDGEMAWSTFLGYLGRSGGSSGRRWAGAHRAPARRQRRLAGACWTGKSTCGPSSWCRGSSRRTTRGCWRCGTPC
jgi:transposase